MSKQRFQPGQTLDILSGTEFESYMKAANQRMSDFEDMMARGVKKPVSPSQTVTVTSGAPFSIVASDTGPKDGYVWIGGSISVYDFALGTALKDILAVTVESSVADQVNGRNFVGYLLSPLTVPPGNSVFNLQTLRTIIRPGEHVMLRGTATTTATGTVLQSRMEAVEVPAPLLWKALM
jgi:hypothetical protein